MGSDPHRRIMEGIQGTSPLLPPQGTPERIDTDSTRRQRLLSEEVPASPDRVDLIGNPDSLIVTLTIYKPDDLYQIWYGSRYIELSSLLHTLSCRSLMLS